MDSLGTSAKTGSPPHIPIVSEHATKPRSVSFIVYPGIEIIDLSGPMEVFAFANGILRNTGVCTETAYTIEVLAAHAGPIISSCGLQIIADRSYASVTEDRDTVLVVGTPNITCLLSDLVLQEWLLTAVPKIQRLASVCTGAFLLAETGLLDGRHATTHWDYCAWLAHDYPDIKVQPNRIFVRDGSISTSGGVTSGIDMALSFIEEDWGNELALSVARYLVVFLKRPGGQSQFSAYLTSHSHRPEVRDLQAWVMAHLEHDLRVEILAERLHMSPRNFSRLFLSAAGMTPAKFVELARIDAARHYLESTALSISAVAAKAGFIDQERMRRAFVRQLGVNPQSYRGRFNTVTKSVD